MVKLTSWVRPMDVALQMRPLELHIGPYREVLRTTGRFSRTPLGRPQGVILPSGKGCWICLNKPEYALKMSQYEWICLDNTEYD